MITRWTNGSAREHFEHLMHGKLANVDGLREIRYLLPDDWRIVRDGFNDYYMLYVPGFGLVDVLANQPE